MYQNSEVATMQPTKQANLLGEGFSGLLLTILLGRIALLFKLLIHV
jgi:hypothetical protein